MLNLHLPSNPVLCGFLATVLSWAIGGVPSGFSQDVKSNETESSPTWDRLKNFFEPPQEFRNDFGSYSSLLRGSDGNVVTNPRDWPRRRAEISDYWYRKLGPWPDTIDHPKLEILNESSRDELLQQRVRFEIGPNQTTEGWLLTPQANRPLPAVVVVFYEPDTSIGLKNDNPYRDFGIQLAKRGFVTLNVGTPGGNAYDPDIANATCQPLMYHAYVAANCYNLLADLPEVDKNRIGIVGHSYGGKWSMFAGAFWEKFAAVAVSDPGIVFDESRPSVNYWEPWYLGRGPDPQRKPGIPTTENPRTGAYAEIVAEAHDLHEVHALIAPRPFFVSGGSEDPARRWQALNRTLQVNHLLGFPHRIGFTTRSEHSPNEESNAAMFDFFTHFLMAP